MFDLDKVKHRQIFRLDEYNGIRSMYDLRLRRSYCKSVP